MPIRANAQVKRLENLTINPKEILHKIGKLLVQQSKEAFDQQAFDNVPWVERYPNQSAPFINIAGAVEDLKLSNRISPNKFLKRPSLVDSGDLMKSIKYETSTDNPVPLISYGAENAYVDLYSDSPYAGKQQNGLRSVQYITDIIRNNLKEFLRRERTKFKRTASKYERERKEQRNKMEELIQAIHYKGFHVILNKEPKMLRVAKDRLSAAGKLGFLFRMHTLVTDINERPFIGVSESSERKIKDIIKESFEKAAR